MLNSVVKRALFASVRKVRMPSVAPLASMANVRSYGNLKD